MWQQLAALNRDQKSAFLASFLGWTLDAFDFFLMVFVIHAIAADFSAAVTDVTYAVTLTLAMRPLGALLFGRLADRFGRRPVLMADIILYSVLELASALAPSLTALLVLRALFGIAMGGEWGLGSALVMETIPANLRGLVSGILQEGYATGYLIAAIVYYTLFDTIGWRGMFAVGVLPALLVLYIRSSVKESPVFERMRAAPSHYTAWRDIKTRWPLFLYAVILMTAFNFFSHGTQDLFPTFLQVQHNFTTHQVGLIAIIANIGAIIGGIFFGSLSERIGRRRAIVIAALLALPVIPLWAFSSSMATIAAGAFLVQIMVQGAWGVIPAHLNELSPDHMRGTFPGFTYQLGNLLASANASIQASFAASHGGNYGLALATVTATVAVAIALLAGFGKEAKGVVFGQEND